MFDTIKDDFDSIIGKESDFDIEGIYVYSYLPEASAEGVGITELILLSLLQT